MSRYLSTFRPSGSIWLWAVCGLVAVSLTQGAGNHHGLARAAVSLEPYEPEFSHFPLRGSLYESTDATSFPGVPIEMLSMSMQSLPSLSVELPQPGTTTMPPVRGFFDIFVEMQAPGSPPQVHSFFDVFADFSLTGVSGSPTTGQVEIEMLQMNLVGSGPFMIRESPTLPSRGLHTISEQSPGGPYQIDSFFDVFTELSLDGGQSWIPASGPIRMDLTRVGVPEPASLSLAAVVGLIGLAVRLRRRWK